MQYPENVKKQVENIFAWTLEHNPYPESITDKITWIHDMEKTLKCRYARTEATQSGVFNTIALYVNRIYHLGDMPIVRYTGE